jgi:hypothetical protein
MSLGQRDKPHAWRNQYWPAQYIVDQHGQIVFSHAGEGQYDEIERTVQRLLKRLIPLSQVALDVVCGLS